MVKKYALSNGNLPGLPVNSMVTRLGYLTLAFDG